MCYKKKIKLLRKFDCLLPSITRKKIKKRKNKPGERPFFRSMKTSVSNVYKEKLKKKQKLKTIFCINERQLRYYIKLSLLLKTINPFFALYNILNSRLDFILYKLNLSKTILEARQLISHGHVYINEIKEKKPSFICKTKSVINLSYDHFFHNKNNKIFSSIDEINQLSTDPVDNKREIRKVVTIPSSIDLTILSLIKNTFEFYL